LSDSKISLQSSKISAKESCFCDIIVMSPFGMWFMVLFNSIISQTERRFLYSEAKKCRIYTALGVSQTPNKYIRRKELIVREESNKKQRNDMERIIALALVKNLYNQGKISEFVFRNIRSDTEKKVSIENRNYI